MEREKIQQFITESRTAGVPDTQIFSFLDKKGMIQQMQQAVGIESPQQEGFVSRVTGRLGDIFSTRASNFMEGVERQSAGEQTALESGFQFTGQVAGATLDMIGLGLQELFRLAPEKVKETVGDVGKQFIESPIGQAGINALSQGVEAYQSWKAENPREAANLESIGNIASLLVTARGEQAAKRQAGQVGQTAQARVAQAGDRLEDTGRVGVEAKRQTAIQTMVQPETSLKTRTARVTDLQEGGVIRPRTLAPSPQEVKMAEAVNRIPTVDPSKPVLHNVNEVHRQISTLAESLEQQVRGSQVLVPKKEHMAALKRTATQLQDSPFITGDAAKSAQKMIKKYQALIDVNPGTAEGVLQARKQFDRWLKSQKPKIFIGDTANAMELAANELRRTSNQVLSSKVKNVPVRNLLSEQSTLYRAIDNMGIKAAREAGSSVERLGQKLQSLVTMRGRFSSTAGTLIGLGGLGAGATFAPVFTGAAAAGLGGYQVYKLATSPVTRKALGTTLKRISRAIPTSTGTERQLLMEARDIARELLISVGVTGGIVARTAAQEIAQPSQ
jgi:hypothetical protein